MTRDLTHDIDMNPNILVYGTLRRTCGANGMMFTCTPQVLVRVPGFVLLDEGVPAMVRVKDQKHEVTCECYTLDDEETLATLDRYESEGGEYGYNRVLVHGRVIGPVDEGSPLPDGIPVGDTIEAWVYEYIPWGEEQTRAWEGYIESGDWNEYKDSKRRWREYRGPYEVRQDGS